MTCMCQLEVVYCRTEESPYFLVSGEYDQERVGPAGLALQESSWKIPASAEAEKSVSFCKGSMIKILRDHYENAEAFRLVQRVMAGKTPQDSTSVCNRQTHVESRTRDARYAAARYLCFAPGVLMHGTSADC